VVQVVQPLGHAADALPVLPESRAGSQVGRAGPHPPPTEGNAVSERPKIGDRFVGPDGAVVTYLGTNPQGVVMAKWDEADEPWVFGPTEWARDFRPVPVDEEATARLNAAIADDSVRDDLELMRKPTTESAGTWFRSFVSEPVVAPRAKSPEEIKADYESWAATPPDQRIGKPCACSRCEADGQHEAGCAAHEDPPAACDCGRTS
jgi:hypothetical protein